MKKIVTISLVFALALILGIGSVGYAQSAKNAVQVSNVTLVPWTAGNEGWVTILGNANITAPDAVIIHTSQQKDLIFGSSLECGLYTRTRVKSSGGIEDTEWASAGVRLRIVVDPGTSQERIAEPGSDPTNDGKDDTGVTYCYRKQTLSAKLQGIIQNLNCFPDGVFTPGAPGCVLTPEEIELILDTLEASAFFFVLDDLGAGDHNVIVQARIDTAVSSLDAEAKGLIGKGAVTVEEVRLLKGAGILTP